MRSRKPRGPNWTRWRRFFFLASLAMLVWLLVPAGRCTFERLDETEIAGVERESEAWDSDQHRVSRGFGFVSDITDAIGACFELHPITHQEVWKERVALGCTVAWAICVAASILTTPRPRMG